MFFLIKNKIENVLNNHEYERKQLHLINTEYYKALIYKDLKLYTKRDLII